MKVAANPVKQSSSAHFLPVKLRAPLVVTVLGPADLVAVDKELAVVLATTAVVLFATLTDAIELVIVVAMDLAMELVIELDMVGAIELDIIEVIVLAVGLVADEEPAAFAGPRTPPSIAGGVTELPVDAIAAAL